MGEVQSPLPVVLIMAAFSRDPQALQWAQQTAESRWGPIAFASPAFAFDFTKYYDREMGDGLKKKFFAFATPFDPGRLPQIKLQSNAWEAEYASSADDGPQRPLNLDPGYVSEAKLVLATTKDRDHRLYLADGIYAEGTLYYHGGAWCDRPWTYPDYRQDTYHAFFSQCRKLLREQFKPKA